MRMPGAVRVRSGTSTCLPPSSAKAGINGKLPVRSPRSTTDFGGLPMSLIGRISRRDFIKLGAAVGGATGALTLGSRRLVAMEQELGGEDFSAVAHLYEAAIGRRFDR